MTLHLIDIFGFIGAFCTLLAFFNVSHGRWSGQSYQYQLTNLAAGIILAIYAWQKHAAANVFLNVVWCAIGLYGLGVVVKLQSHRNATKVSKSKRL